MNFTNSIVGGFFENTPVAIDFLTRSGAVISSFESTTGSQEFGFSEDNVKRFSDGLLGTVDVAFGLLKNIYAGLYLTLGPATATNDTPFVVTPQQYVVALDRVNRDVKDAIVGSMLLEIGDNVDGF